MKFKASLDKAAYFLTIACFILFGVITYQMFNRTTSLGWVAWLITAFVWLVFIFCYVLHPLAYSVTGSSVIIHRLVAGIHINRNEISEARQLRDDELDGTIRTFGVGGLFGYFGKFRNLTHGKMTWYATQRQKYVLLVAGDKKIILTPDSPGEFVAAFKNTVVSG